MPGRPAAWAVLLTALLHSATPFPRRSAAPLSHADGPPAGYTGGFGEPTCHECHSEFAVDEPTGFLGVEGLPSLYQPGGTYRVSVVLRGDDMERAGFQGAFRFSSGPQGGRQAGRVAPGDTSVMIRSHDGIDYVQHTRGGSVVNPGNMTVWQVRWTAPAASDPVVFHVAANNANGDDSPLGDFIYTAEASTAGTAR